MSAPLALVFGGSGQIGAAVIPRLLAAGWQVQAVSRTPPPARPGLTWLRGEFASLEGLPAQADAVFSLGPLDLFSLWYAQTALETGRVIAFGSTSLDTKQDSGDAAERAVAVRLAEAEARIFATATARGVAATLLRPTLVYGAGRDRTLTRIAAMARRTGLFVLPGGATGLRQPVHVDDLAAATLAVLEQPRTAGRAYALPGGETLAYRDMVRRTLAALEPPARLLEVPAPLFSGLAWLGQRLGRLQGLNAEVIARMREDLVFDPAPAQADFGYTPRPFRPTATMLLPPP